MARNEALVHERAHSARWEPGPWLRSKHWDLCFLTFSGVLVVVPLLLYEVMGSSAMFVNLFVAGVIGGPHMYATFFRTTFNPSFRQRHRFVTWSSLLIPILVIACALWHFQLLITLFFFWASVHVLHQIAYIVECYNRTQPRHVRQWSHLIDYALVFSCLFPIASYKFIHDEFYIGSTLLLYPDFLKTPVVFYLVTGFFILSLLLFLGKTLAEIRQGTAHYAKILLIGTTVALSLLITSYGGQKLEIAFQGFNIWHSFQYMALTWYIMHLRQQRGEPERGIMQWLVDKDQGRFRYFYGITIVCTLLALVLIGAVVALPKISFEQSYYIVVLSFLLIHYYHDHILFTQPEDIVPV